MATFSVTYSFIANTKARAAEVNQNFSDVLLILRSHHHDPNLYTNATPITNSGIAANAQILDTQLMSPITRSGLINPSALQPVTVPKGGTGLAGSFGTGDILYALSANVLARLPIGSAGQSLKVSGGLPAWGDTVLNQLAMSSLLAGENIAQYDAVSIGDGSSALLSSLGGNATIETIGGATWIAQSFTTGADTISIKSVKFYVSHPSGSFGRTVTISIRANSGGSPTGADIGGYTAVWSGTATTSPTQVEATFATAVPVSASTTYHVVMRADSNPTQIDRNNSASQGTTKSTDSGGGWSANNGALRLEIYDIDSVPGSIYKSSAATNDFRANNFIGFSSAAAITSGNTGTIAVDGVVTLTGLSDGSRYYLSDTPGAIATSAGSQSRKVGLALSSTAFLIKHDNS